MKNNTIKLALLTGLISSLYACGGSSCSTKEDVQAKLKEASAKLEDVVKSGDIAKITALGTSAMKLGTIAAINDPQKACDAIDELMEDF